MVAIAVILPPPSHGDQVGWFGGVKRLVIHSLMRAPLTPQTEWSTVGEAHSALRTWSGCPSQSQEVRPEMWWGHRPGRARHRPRRRAAFDSCPTLCWTPGGTTALGWIFKSRGGGRSRPVAGIPLVWSLPDDRLQRSASRGITPSAGRLPPVHGGKL